jgi:PAS domain S-box-containing protein
MQKGSGTDDIATTSLFHQHSGLVATILNTVKALVIVVDSQGQILCINEVFSAVTGYSMQDLHGKYFEDLFATAAEASFVKQMLQQPETRVVPQRHKTQWITQNGSEFLVAWSSEPIIDPTGQVEQIVITGTDLTEPTSPFFDHAYNQVQTSLECQVHEHNARLQQALDFEATLKRITDRVRDSLDENHILQAVVQELGMALGVEVCDTGIYDDRYTTSTIRYEYTKSLPPAHGKTLKIKDWQPIYDHLLRGEHVQFCLASTGPLRDISRHFSTLACPIFDNSGVLGELWLFKPKEDVFDELEIRLVQQVANQCAIAIRQARLYEAAEAQVEALANLNRLKDEFLSRVSHELRTPISNIKVATQMLGIALNQDRPFFAEMAKPTGQRSKIAQYFQVLHDECEREIGLINDLLDLQRLESGVQTPRLELMELKYWLPAIVSPFQDRACDRQQTLTVELDEGLPPLLSTPSSLMRILSELLDNACKYTPGGETISFNVRADADKVYFRVTNSGIEIPPSQLSRIFDKFYRIPNADPWEQGGTGLGLALALKLAKRLGGSILPKSGDGCTSFTLVLPLVILEHED